ncbi:MAG: hypothetical protein A2219_02005 [Elusimicrobia bacterium RIFOXYA2_FULL_50_26]|nr:MAG: hypothetical protein A2219_02005 [Elusimicrobia bacterium RIFOXYA2_FULL_50_26]OGS24032.1 MAG: hypothetical protein A2314_02625 [Elusimicrobia bacterium RIFOXYB2_FULL_50_12]
MLRKNAISQRVPAGLYIHIPFCRRKCGYCDFYSTDFNPRHAASLINAVINEMSFHGGARAGTVYLGGGTPSILPARLLNKLFAAMRSSFDISESAEVTAEANPESLTAAACKSFAENGVNRLSIGVQSFNDSELAMLGRIHTSRDAVAAFLRARKAGFKNVSIDLIYGLPGQSERAWLENLKRAMALGPDHLSIYPLTIEHDTPLSRAGTVVSQDSQAALYEIAMDYLQSCGFEQYELSNWAKPGYACRHNLVYWNNESYIGLGPAAASYLNGRRFKNIDSVSGYISAIKSGKNAVSETDEISTRVKLAEEMILKLRLNGGVALRTGITDIYGDSIKKLTSSRLIETAGSHIRLTRKGKLLANQVFMEFV